MILKAISLFFLLTVAVLHAEIVPISIGALDWDAGSSVMWRWANGRINNLSFGGYLPSRITPAADPFSAEVTIRPTKKLGKDRVEAGLALVRRRDRSVRDAWRLTLVDHGQRKAELTLIRNGQNCTIPTQIETGRQFQWEYGREYRLRLRSDHGRATGEVLTPQGEVLCRLAAASENGEGKFPAGLALYTTALQSEFHDPAASTRSDETAVPEPLPSKETQHRPQYRSPANVSDQIRSRATGFFRVEKNADGRWWLIDPAGNGFFACGIDGLHFGGRFCEALGYSPYQRNVQKLFGPPAAWGEHTMKRLKTWGFNFAGTCDSQFRNRLPFSVNLMLGSSFSAFGDEYDIMPYRGRVGTGLPNPFHPRFAEWCRRRFLEQVGHEIENPYFMGYFCDNELCWQGTNVREIDGSGVFNAVLAKPASHTAKIALARFLNERFRGDVAAFNRFWGTQIVDFSPESLPQKLPHRTNRQLTLKQDFLTLTAETYFRTIRDTIRAVDPNHMLLGCRFIGLDAHERIWRAAGKYCDVVSFNIYPYVDFTQEKLFTANGELVSLMNRVQEWTGRPMLVTEWAFLGLDSGMPCLFGGGHRLATQTERSRAAELFVRTLATRPYMVGHNWYRYCDDPKLGVRKNFPETGNYGLVNEQDEPYRELTETFRRIHTDVDALRSRMPPHRNLPKQGRLYAGFSAKADTAFRSDVPLKITGNSRHIVAGNREIELHLPENSNEISLLLDERPVGQLRFLLRLLDPDGNTVWEHADRIESISAKRLTSGILLQGEAKGESTAGNFSIHFRILLPKTGTSTIAEVTKVCNLGKSPLKLQGIYFMPYPKFSPRTKREFPHSRNPYANFAAWESDSGDLLGAAASSTFIKFNFYREKDGSLHPDSCHPLQSDVAPGAAYRPPTPCYIFIFTGKGDPAEVAKKLVYADLGITQP